MITEPRQADETKLKTLSVPDKATTLSVSAVAFAASSVVPLVAANASRKNLLISNQTAGTVYIRSATSEMFIMISNEKIFIPNYTGELYVGFGPSGSNFIFVSQFI